jgi:antitoxin component YwqK of YwqJK toxin-antitoxin module
MGPPTSASISISKNAYATGEAVTFNMSGNGNTNTLWVYRIDGQWQNHYSNAGNSFELTFGWEGQYKALMETWNGQGSKISNTVYFKIGGPSYATIKASKDTYTTDENGRTTAVTIYQPDGTLLSSSTYTREGLKETITSTLPDGTVNQIVVLTYDEHGNLLTQEIYDSSNNLVSKETHTWKAVVVPIDCPRASV